MSILVSVAEFTAKLRRWLWKMIYGFGYSQKSLDNKNEFIITKHISKYWGTFQPVHLYVLQVKLVEVIEYANELVKSANHKRPIFAKFESEEKFRAGEISVVSVDLGVVTNALKDLRNHPRIIIKDKVDNELETRLEFYYNDSLIMAGSISYFRQIMTNPTNTNHNEPKLGLGDRFTLDEFP
jgi:hypothetical protein